MGRTTKCCVLRVYMDEVCVQERHWVVKQTNQPSNAKREQGRHTCHGVREDLLLPRTHVKGHNENSLSGRLGAKKVLVGTRLTPHGSSLPLLLFQVLKGSHRRLDSGLHVDIGDVSCGPVSTARVEVPFTEYGFLTTVLLIDSNTMDVSPSYKFVVY